MKEGLVDCGEGKGCVESNRYGERFVRSILALPCLDASVLCVEYVTWTWPWTRWRITVPIR